MSGIKFLKNFIQKPSMVGAVWPSSPFLSKVIASEVALDSAKAVIELGPGTGVITPYIVEQLAQNARYFAVELNEELYSHFKEKYPALTIYNEDASQLEKLVASEKLKSIDTIISGLPWAAFPEELQKALLDAIIGVLSPGGYFATFAYLQGTLLPAGQRFKSLLGEYFGEVKTSKIEWRNLPPAFVYRCKK